MQKPLTLAMSALDLEAKNQGDIASALYRAHQTYRDNRPRNTNAQYRKKQEQWIDWCLNTRKFQDRDTVTEGKLVLWLQDCVIPRGSNARGRMRGAMLSHSGVEAYIKPIVDLFVVPPPSLFFY
jgi:hypothetical protein